MWVLTNFPTFLIKKVISKNSHMCTQKKHLEETNSVVNMKNVLKISRVPKMGHFYWNLSKNLKLSFFFVKMNTKNQICRWFYVINFKINDFLHPIQKNILIFFLQKFHYGYLNESPWKADNVFWYSKNHQRSFRTRISNMINKRFI